MQTPANPIATTTRTPTPAAIARLAVALTVTLVPILVLSGCAMPAGSSGTAAIDQRHIRDGGIHIIAETPGNCPVCNVYELRRDSVIRILAGQSLGTGVIIDDAGTVLTNAHVVGDSATVSVETFQGTTVQGTVERTNKAVDLALIRISAKDVKWSAVTPAKTAPPTVGSTVYVIGHPAGLGWTLTTGIISGLRSEGEVQPIQLLQITAAVSPGNSGGPAFDADGNWIGTVSSKLIGPGLENISFVIPAAELRRFLAVK